jgi:hypothetical protein
VYRVLVVEPGGKGLLGNLGVYGKTILKYLFEEHNERASIEFIWLRIGTSGGL